MSTLKKKRIKENKKKKTEKKIIQTIMMWQ